MLHIGLPSSSSFICIYFQDNTYMMLSCSGQSAVVVSGVTTYQSSRSALWREGATSGGCVSDWPADGVVRHVQGCGQMRERGKERQQGERRCQWLLAVCTWAGQSRDQTTLDITRSICMSVVYDYQVTDMDGRGMCGVAETTDTQ